MFFAIGTINLVLLTVLFMLIFQIRAFVRKAEEYSSQQRQEILHPMLDFEQIRSIPNLRDIEIMLLAIALALISYFLAVVQNEGKTWAETYPHWWATFEVASLMVFCHAVLRYARHMVERERSDWHRAYEQTRDFSLFRHLSLLIVLACVVYMAFYLPQWELPNAPEKMYIYKTSIVFLKFWALLAFIYLLNWLMRVRGELVTLMKTIGILLIISGIVGWWIVSFSFNTEAPAKWAFNEIYHLCFTGIYLALILLLFKDNMVLLSATHRAAQIIADEKKVMLDFLTRVADNQSWQTDGEGPSMRRLSQDVDYILRLTLHFAIGQSNAQAGAIYLLDTALSDSVEKVGTGTRLIPRVVEGPYPPLQELPIDYLATRVKYINELFLTETVDLEKYPFFNHLMQDGKMLYLPNTDGRNDIPQQPTDFLHIHSIIAVPLRIQDSVLGLLIVINKSSEKDRGWDPFTPQDASLLSAVGDQAAIAITNAKMHEVFAEQERLEREIEIARKVQESLLPHKFPELPGYEIYAVNKAAQQIGGDYYDFVWMGEKQLAFVIADVAGKGIPGALTMATLRSALRALANENQSARDLAIHLNHFIFNDLKKDVFISLSLGVLDLNQNVLSIVRAGHEPTIYYPAAQQDPVLIESEGMALGLDRGYLFEESLNEFKLQLKPGDLVMFYTDGLTEAMNAERKEFSLEKVLLFLKNHRNKSLQEMVSALQREVDEFTGEGVPAHDDITLVTLKLR